jgi:cytidine deaminase
MMLAIAAKEDDVFVEKISPCGACRQVLLETEKRYGKPIKLLLYGREETLVIESATSLLPLCFESKGLKIR